MVDGGAGRSNAGVLPTLASQARGGGRGLRKHSGTFRKGVPVPPAPSPTGEKPREPPKPEVHTKCWNILSQETALSSSLPPRFHTDGGHAPAAGSGVLQHEPLEALCSGPSWAWPWPLAPRPAPWPGGRDPSEPPAPAPQPRDPGAPLVPGCWPDTTFVSLDPGVLYWAGGCLEAGPRGPHLPGEDTALGHIGSREQGIFFFFLILSMYCHSLRIMSVVINALEMF